MRSFLVLLTILALSLPVAVEPADAQSKRRRQGSSQGAKKSSGKRGGAKAADTQPKKTQVFDFSGLDVSGQLRAPQLLYFLDRANEELERASLERRSFIPEMVRSIEEEGL